MFCTTVERLTRVTRDEVTGVSGHVGSVAGEANGAAGSLAQAAAQGEKAVSQTTDTVLYGRLGQDYDRWASFSPDDVWVEPLERADGSRLGYEMPAAQGDVDTSRFTSPNLDMSGVVEMLEHPADIAESWMRGPFTPPWSGEPKILRSHGVFDGRGMLLNADLGAGAERSVLIVDGSTAAKVAEARGLLGAGAGGSELYLDSCGTGVVGGAAESFASTLGKSGSFSGTVIAPTDKSATVGLPGETAVPRPAVVANYDQDGEMLPLFRTFDVQNQAAAE
jgi:hypothetical protein